MNGNRAATNRRLKNDCGGKTNVRGTTNRPKNGCGEKTNGNRGTTIRCPKNGCGGKTNGSRRTTIRSPMNGCGERMNASRAWKAHRKKRSRRLPARRFPDPESDRCHRQTADFPERKAVTGSFFLCFFSSQVLTFHSIKQIRYGFDYTIDKTIMQELNFACQPHRYRQSHRFPFFGAIASLSRFQRHFPYFRDWVLHSFYFFSIISIGIQNKGVRNRRRNIFVDCAPGKPE